jgi:hypothetical protein
LSPDHAIEINSPIRYFNGFELDGNGAKINLMKDAPTTTFSAGVALFAPKNPRNAENISIHGLTIDCNRDYQRYVKALFTKPWGHGFHNIFFFGIFNNVLYSNSKNIHIYNITAKNSLGDLIRGEGVSGCRIHDIQAEKLGHDVIHLVAENSEIYNVKAKLAVNAGVRLRSSKHVDIRDCELDGTELAYSPGIEIQSSAVNWICDDINIFNNKISDTYGPGIQVIGEVPNNGLVRIHHNLITECGQMPASNNLPGVGGIAFDGIPVEIQYNTLDNNYGYGVFAGPYNVVSTYKTSSKIRYNIITHTQKAYTQGIYSGTGIANLTGSRNVIEVTGNCQYGNKTANHYQVTATNPINLDPLFVDSTSGDYHLRSIYGHFTTSGYEIDENTSPCINFSTKAEIGAYNSSQEASKYEPVIDPKTLPALVLPRASKEDAEKLLKLLKEMGILTDKDYYYFLNVEACPCALLS